MANFPGAKAYPALVNRMANVDVVEWVKGREISLARGGTEPDFNVKLRGVSRRIDRLPRRPYP